MSAAPSTSQGSYKEYVVRAPKYGAGSEFGREQREEARRKRYGITTKKFRTEDQPWVLTTGGKKFKSLREGGVSENVSWYVFMQAKDGAFEAFPVDEWHNFQPFNRYNTLSFEEAEKEYEKRDKIMNYFSVMYQKKLRKYEDDPEGDEGGIKKKTSKRKSLLLSEMDDWMSDESDNDEDEDAEHEDSDSGKSKKKKSEKTGKRLQGGKKKAKEDEDSAEEYEEESDDANEGAEISYISSDSSDSEKDNDEKVIRALSGVDEEDALKKLLNSDEEEEEEKKDDDGENEENKDDDRENGEVKKKKKKKKDKKESAKSEDKSSDSDNDSVHTEKRLHTRKKEVSDLKRKLTDPESTYSKRQKLSSDSSNVSHSSDNGVSEDSIRRYLMRKPMTTTELLQKLKSKKTGLNSEHLVHAVAQRLKKINPVKQMIKGKMYLSLKS